MCDLLPLGSLFLSLYLTLCLLCDLGPGFFLSLHLSFPLCKLELL